MIKTDLKGICYFYVQGFILTLKTETTSIFDSIFTGIHTIKYLVGTDIWLWIIASHCSLILLSPLLLILTTNINHKPLL